MRFYADCILFYIIFAGSNLHGRFDKCCVSLGIPGEIKTFEHGGSTQRVTTSCLIVSSSSHLYRLNKVLQTYCSGTPNTSKTPFTTQLVIYFGNIQDDSYHLLRKRSIQRHMLRVKTSRYPVSSTTSTIDADNQQHIPSSVNSIHPRHHVIQNAALCTGIQQTCDV